ncbi:MAG: phosphotransferase family protein [Gammaproteobacteria bacterium]|nr:phosphotransferase family protein [Gammaproteobacteria bacterium]
MPDTAHIEGPLPETTLGAGLAALLGEVLPAARGLQVSDLKRTTSGLSRENWVFEARWRDEEGARRQRMILRRDPPASLLVTDRAWEFRVLRALESTPVPAPPVRWVDADGARFGAPAMLMDFLDGECDWFVLGGARPLAERVALGRRFIDLLAAIQAVDWRTLGLGDARPEQAYGAHAELDFWQAEYERVRLEPLPEMDLALAWLREHAPVAQAVVLVHGDFKPGNALLVGERINAMLDWETAHLGDPLEDLGWITNPPRAREQQIAGAWTRAEIVAAFTAATGFEVEPRALRWWNVFSCWKLSVIVLTGVAAFTAGTMDRIYHAPAWLVQQMLALMEA